MIITAELVASIQRAVGEEDVCVTYRHWHPQTHNEGYNALLAGPNWKAALDTLKALKAQTNPGNGEPSLVNPTTPAQGGTTVGYKTEDEMRADIAKPLYREMTPAGEQFRAQVQERTRLAAWRRNR